jgi:type II secretory pathway pseudopilin PulG
MRGHTLVELATVLLLMSVAGASLAPAARRYRDRAAVVAAREITVGLVAEARLAAMAAGAAWVHLDADSGRARALTADSLLSDADLADELGVVVELGGGRRATEISFNALGLGRMSSETVVFRRGEATATLVVSGLGRTRRQ